VIERPPFHKLRHADIDQVDDWFRLLDSHTLQKTSARPFRLLAKLV
jgi:hypothetical protein